MTVSKKRSPQIGQEQAHLRHQQIRNEDISVKNALCHTAIAAAVFAAGLLYADADAQRRLGDAAFYAGDYLNAISSYESSLLLADKEKDADGWAQAALNLGIARLRNGDIIGARKVYEEFRRRNPLRSAGTLPGDLLAAEGNYQEAEKFFRSLLGNDPALADATMFSMAAMYMSSGRNEDAYRFFSKLAANAASPWQVSARNEAIYSLIRLGKTAEAMAKIGEIPASQRNADVELLRYLAEVYAGKVANLKKNLTEFLEKMPPKPHIRLMELLLLAAERSSEAGDSQFASEALRQALAFSADEPVKKEIFRRLISVLLTYSPEASVTEACNYVRQFPVSEDRGQVVLSAASVLCEKDQYKFALDLYGFMADNDFTAEDKILAASGAVIAAEKIRDFAALEKFVRFLVASTPLDERINWQIRYAVFLEKNGKLAQADKELKNAFDAADKSVLKESVAFARLGFYIRAGNADGIRDMANMLQFSKEPIFAAAGKWELGTLFGDSGEFDKARKYFTDITALDVPAAAKAAFKAAQMAFKMHEFKTAAEEFAAFAVKYPASELAPDALFFALDAYKAFGDSAKSAEAEEKLREKYSSSNAYAALVLRSAVDRGKNGDIGGAIGELESLEERFRDDPIAMEASMQKAIFLERSGEREEALEIFSKLRSMSASPLMAESNMHAGEIFFDTGRLDEAKAAFLACAAVDPGSLVSDIAYGRAGDCDLVSKENVSAEVLLKCAENFEELARSTVFPQIRLQAFCKAGVAYEHGGKNTEAVSAYENAVYSAYDMVEMGLLPDPQWSIRSCENALRLIAAEHAPGALQRGLRLIERCGGLLLPEPDFTEKMRDNFRKQLNQRR